MEIIKATEQDIDSIEKIYDRIHDAEEAGKATPGWIRGVYPVRKTAEDALKRGDLFVMKVEDEGGTSECGDGRGMAGDNAAAVEKPVEEKREHGQDPSKVVAAAVINHIQVPEYADAHWRCQAEGEEAMVLHCLVTDPLEGGNGYGKAFVEFYEKYAREKGCKALRMDTQVRNERARKMYGKLGFEEVGVVGCVFNGIPDVKLVCLEKVLE